MVKVDDLIKNSINYEKAYLLEKFSFLHMKFQVEKQMSRN
jgi:hypothetical protein